jgi:hypothetical protein
VCGPLFLGGKLRSPGRLNAVAPGVLVHVVDQLTGRRFLVDTGAAFSIIPHSSSLPPSGRGIVGPTGQPIQCWGEKKVQIKLSGHLFEWTFLQAEVQMAILGMDFLRAFKLSVDPAAGKLVQAGSGLVLFTISLSSGPTASAIVSSSAKEVFGIAHNFNGLSVHSSKKVSKPIFGLKSAAEHFPNRQNLLAVPGIGGQAASSSTAVPVPGEQAAPSPSAVPVPGEQAAPSPSAVPVPSKLAAKTSKEMFIPSLIVDKKDINF